MAKQRTKNQERGPEVRERILEVGHLMAKGEFFRPTTIDALAAKWGVADKTVENYASQAANLIRLRIGDDEQIKGEMLAALRAIQSVCFQRASERHPDGHRFEGELRERNAYQWFNTAIQAMDRIAGLTGIDAPKKVHLKNEITLDTLDSLRSAVGANECALRIASDSFDMPSETLTDSAAYSTSYLNPVSVPS